MSPCFSPSCPWIKELRTLYACSFDLKTFPWAELVSHLKGLPYEELVAHQDSLLDSTVDHRVFKRAPPRSSYVSAFLKRLLNEIEGFAETRLYTAYLESTKESNLKSDLSYRHYIVGDDIITLLESNSFISGGTTGLVTWQAGVALANWALDNKKLLENSHVLELGSGSGLTGLVASTSCGVASYTFSDSHHLVLQQLKTNISLNSTLLQTRSSKTPVEVLFLDWERPEKADILYKPNIILAADVVYDPALVGPLCSTLKFFLSASGSVGVVACTVRNQETVSLFLKEIGSGGLRATLETSPVPKVLLHSTDTPINIYTIETCS